MHYPSKGKTNHILLYITFSISSILHTGASNYMNGGKALFAELDENISSNVKFGDDPTVDIHLHRFIDSTG